MKPLLLVSFVWLAPLVPRAAPVELEEVRTLVKTGRYEKAEALLEGDSHADPQALRLLLDLARRKGKWKETETYARRLIQLYETGRFRDASAIGQAAYAAWKLDRWQDANLLFLEAAKVTPVPVAVFVDWGNLYLEKYNAAEAESIFNDALKLPTQHAKPGLDAAYVGLARALKDQSRPGGSEALDKALQLNPESLEALTFSASLALQEEDWKGARSWIQRGLKINRNYLPLLELECALHYFGEQTDQYEKTRKHLLGINPRNGDLFETLGEIATVRGRLEEATEFYRESVRRNPRQWSALASLGVNLLRLGKEEEGRRILEQAYAYDPFNIWTVNTLRLLDSFENFARYETPHFSIKVHQKEAEALSPYVEELAEKCLALLERKYNHRVKKKYLLELYPDHEDFAVRTLGLPGLGALGATFGRVVAMDSPSARPSGKFHWGSTLWHEVAHIVTLSLSSQKVPRWFTEGISMMEERGAAQGWGDGLTPGFVQAYKEDKLLPLADLNSGFIRPKSRTQIKISYYQAGWVCDFLVSRYGIGKIQAMLIAFGQGKLTETVFREVLGLSTEEVDRQFRREIDEVLRPLVPRLDPAVVTDVLETHPDAGIARLLDALKNHPDNYFLNLEVGKKLQAASRYGEATGYLHKALELFPNLAGEGSPYDLLVQIHLERDERDPAIKLLRQWWRTSPGSVATVLKLAGLLAGRGELQEAIQFLEEAMYVDPLNLTAHQKLGDLYLKTDQPKKAVREFRVLLSLQPLDVATVRYQLANALHRSGQSEAARREVLLSLEIAPGLKEAQELLLELVGP